MIEGALAVRLLTKINNQIPLQPVSTLSWQDATYNPG